MTRIKLSMFAGVVLLVIFPFTSFGKVFLSRLIAKGPSIFDTAGWRRIYRAPMVLNGGRLTLSVYGCDEPFIQVMTKLKQAFKLPGKRRLVESAGSAYLQGIADNQISRALGVKLPAPDKSLVFSIAQSQPEFSKSSSIPPPNESFGGLMVPNSIPRTTIRNEDTGARLEIRLSADPPEILINEINEYLNGKGWQPLCPAGDTATTSQRLMIFQCPAELCVVMIGKAAAVKEQALRGKKTCVTILRKGCEGKLK